MAIVVGENSWLTLQEAQDILTHNQNAADWFLVPDSGRPGSLTKENLLISACYEIRSSFEGEIPEITTDKKVKLAQAHMAIFLLFYGEEMSIRRGDFTLGLKTMKYGERTETMRENNVLFLPPNVLNLLSEYSMANNFVDVEG